MGIMSFRAVLFDLDGTLLNTLEDIGDATNYALAQLGFPPHPICAFRYFIGDGVPNLLRRAIPAECQTPEILARGVALMREEYARCWAAKTRPYPGVSDLLDALVHRRIPMAVFSNKPDEFTRLCVAQLLPRWSFVGVMGASPDWPPKPDPAGALEMARRMQSPPSETLYLGDTNTDMQTATAAGMHPVGALWGFRTAAELLTHGARVLLDTPGDLLRLLDEASG